MRNSQNGKNVHSCLEIIQFTKKFCFVIFATALWYDITETFSKVSIQTPSN